jgi:hypothetical protein
MDPTEDIRREMVKDINSNAMDRAGLEGEYGKVWDTAELQNEFSVIGFMSPFVVVRRRLDSVKGSLMFQHSPRFYFNFTEDR